MKNYYEILEIDRKASTEMIEKAYKILAKRYHPDLKDSREKQIYEEKMKEINEAYSVLSDDYKKTTYDNQLEKTTVKREEYDKLVQENNILRQQLERMVNNQRQNNVQNNSTINNMNRIIKEQIKNATTQAKQEAYNNAYVEDMRNREFQKKYKHDLTYYLKLIGLLIITLMFLFLIYQIPIVKSFFKNLYAENLIFRTIVNIFKNTITTGF